MELFMYLYETDTGYVSIPPKYSAVKFRKNGLPDMRTKLGREFSEYIKNENLSRSI